MPDKMPEDMSNKMAENLLVRKYINIMVEIIRNEVFFSSNFFLIMFLLISIFISALLILRQTLRQLPNSVRTTRPQPGTFPA